MTDRGGIQYSINYNGIARIEFDAPGKTVNLISRQALEELDEAVEAVRKNPRVRGLIFLSRKEDHFIGGAEIDARKWLGHPEESLAFVQYGRDVYQKIAALKVPTLAAIHGVCLGGGFELALACAYRLASDHKKTRMGLPEVMLGILPSWGGTTRLPRLIGLSASLDLLLSGRQVNPRRALQMGMVDRIMTSKEIPTQAERFMEELLDHPDAVSRTLHASRLRAQNGPWLRFLNRTALGRALVFRQARRQVLQKTRGRYPAPLQILEVLRKGIGRPIEQALPLEQEAMKALVGERVTQNLVHIFSLRIHAGLPPKEEEAPLQILPVRKVGVLGSGIMGAGIVQWLLDHEIEVRLRDLNEAAVAKGMRMIHDLFKKLVTRRRLSRFEMESRMRLLSPTTGKTGFSNCDLLIEAVAENMDIKKKVIRDIQEAAGDAPIFATNTSSLSVTEMAGAAKKPDRVVGLHFFNPVSQMPLVEVIGAGQTSRETLALGSAFVKQIGKVPLIVRDSPGFLVNRILMAYANEAALLLEEGASVDAVDRAMERFGMPMGPFTMLDVVGLDIAHHTAESIRSALRTDPGQLSIVVERLFKAGRLGRKSGEGFYRYSKKGKDRIPADLSADLAYIRKARGISSRSSISETEITDRLILIMANTAAWCLENKVVEGPGEVDLGLVMGMGFPPFRGGLLKHCDSIGAAVVRSRLDQFSRTFGSRFTPGRWIEERFTAGGGFYPP